MLALRPLLAVAVVLVAVFAAASATPAQPSGISARPELRAAQNALARGDRKTAARHLRAIRPATLDSPAVAAQTALLQTAVVPAEMRLRRYLALAAVYPEREEGLTALIAGLAIAEARLDGRWDEVEEEEVDDEIEEFEEIEEEPIEEPIADEPEPDRGAELSLDGALQVAAPLVETWHLRRPNDPRVVLARRLLARCRLGDAAGSLPRLVLPSGPLPVPSPLGEPIRVVVYRLASEQTDLRPYLEGAAPEKPLLERVLAADKIVPDLEPLPAGVYFVEARSERSAWRRAQRLVVSDLRLATQCFPGGVAVLAGLKGRPQAGVEVTARASNNKQAFPPVTGTTNAQGLVILRMPPTAAKDGRGLTIEASIEKNGLHRTTLAMTQPSDGMDTRGELRGHVLAARPLYRPGETVRGRLLVRVHDHEQLAGALAAAGTRPAARPLAGRRVKLEIRLPNRRVTCEAVTDAWGVAPFTCPTKISDQPGSITVNASVKREEGDNLRCAHHHGANSEWIRVVAHERPAKLDAFKTPPMLMEVKWPDMKQAATAEPVVVIEGKHPTGTPAAGIVGEVRANLGSITDRRRFVLDAAGKARVTFGLASLERPARSIWLRLKVTLTAADGQKVSEAANLLWAQKPAVAAKPDDRDDNLVVKTAKSRAAVGEDLTVTVLGKPNETVLLSVAREVALEVQALTLDAAGRAVTTIVPRAAWWPTIHLTATALGRSNARRRHSWEKARNRKKITLDDPTAKLAVELQSDRKDYGPGERVRFTLTTRDGSGKPTPATVAVAVVDETLFALTYDRTVDPRSRLRPVWHGLSLHEAASAVYDSAWELLGTLLTNGRVSAGGWSAANSVIGLGGGAGGAFGGRRGLRRSYGGVGSAGDVVERDDFRTVAFFSPSVVTDAHGRAVVEFDLPHNLTTWRITLVAVDHGHRGVKTTESIRTRMPLSVGLELPRLMRNGDRLDIPLTAHQIGGVPEDATVAVAIEGEAALGENDREVAIETAPDAGRGRAVSVRAEAEGAAVIRAELSVADEVRDRLKRTLPLATRDTRRVESVSALVQGPATLTPPTIPGMRRGPLQIEVLGSVDALMARAGRYLADYPHGCVEQTTSKLTPLLLALEARRAHGDKHPALTPAQAHRLEVGIARIRDMQQKDGGFAWWTGGGASDPAMSAIAFRFIARMQRAGLDPEAFGIRTLGDDQGSRWLGSIFKQAASSLSPVAAITIGGGKKSGRKDGGGALEIKIERRLTSKASTGLFPRSTLGVLAAPKSGVRRYQRRRALAAVDLAVTRLLLHPKSKPALESATHLAAHLAVLPTGVAARLGHAFYLAGDAQAAGRVLAELRKRFEQAGAVGAGAGLAESPVCRTASMLELVLDLAPNDPLRAQMVGSILRRNRDGRLDHTLGTAWALAALARERATAGASRPAPGAFSVEVRGELDGKTVTRTLACDTEGDCTWRAELPAGFATAEVTGPADRRLLVSARVEHFEDGALAKALSRPIRIDRRVLRIVPHAGEAAEPLKAVVERQVAQGDLLEVELTITAPPELTYLVVECPIPAGFEAIRRPGLVILDDRVVLAVARLPEEGRVVRSFRMVPARTGEVVWPPAWTEAMYEPERRGRSAGGTLTVTGPRPLPASGGVVVLSAAFIEQARRALQAELDENDQKPLLDALGKLQVFPDRRMADWLFEVAPERLAKRGTLRWKGILGKYLSVLGSRTWQRIDGDRLPGLIELMKLDARAACRRLGRELARSGYGAAAAERWRDHRFSTPLEARLLGEAVLEHGAFEGDGWARMEAAKQFFAAVDQTDPATRAAVRAERLARSALKRRSAWSSWRASSFKSLVARPFEEACNALWFAGGSRWNGIHIGNRETPDRIAALRSFLDEVVAAAVADPKRLPVLVEPLEAIMRQATWSGNGSAEPRGHRAIRARLVEIHAAVSDAAVAHLRALDVDRKWALLDLWTFVRDPQFTTAARRADLARALLPAALDRVAMAGNGGEGPAGYLAAEILTSCPAGSREALAVRHLALQILGCGPRRLAAAAWQTLDAADRRAVPTIVLLGFCPRESRNRWILGAIRDRGLAAQIALLRKQPLPKYDDEREWIARNFDEQALRTLKIGPLLEYAALLGPFSREKAARRLVRLVVSGPWSGEQLARWLVQPGDYRKRTVLLEACAARGVTPERWKRDDPFVERYRLMLAARQGDAAALAAVRKWLEDEKMPAVEQPALIWALGRQARVADVMRIGTGSDALPFWHEVLARATPEEVKSTWELGDGWSESERGAVLEILPADLAGRLAEPAFEAWLFGNTYALNVLRRAPTEQALPPLLTAALDPDAKRVKALLAALDERPEVALPLARRLADHASPAAREQAALTAFRITGEAQIWRDATGKPRRAGPETASAYLSAIQTRAQRDGLRAIETALGEDDPKTRHAATEFLSRTGLYLN